MTKTKHTIVVALMLAALTAGTVQAGTRQVVPPPAPETQTDLSGSLETQAVSNYTYHGQKLDGNPVFVPKLNIQKPLFEGGTLQFTAQQVVGTQGSTWFRSQYNLGLALQQGRFTVTPGFQVTAWPERDSKNSQSVNLRVALDDEGLTSVLPTALNPYAYVSSKVDPKSGNYYEVGVAPGKSYGKLDLTVPVAVGVGSQGYYSGATEDETHYAFTSVGVAATYKVTDRLSFKAGSTYFNTDSRLGNGKNSFVSSNIGVAVSF